MRINVEKLNLVLMEQCLSQSMAAEKCKVSTISMHKALNGKPLSLKVIGKIAKGLGVSPSTLVDVKGDSNGEIK